VSWSILGVVGDEKFQGLGGADPPAVYVPRLMVPTGAGALLVRTASDPGLLAAPVRAAFRDLDPQLAVFGLEPLDRTVRRSVSERRFAMTLVALFGSLALLLAAVGVHGVLSYEVTERRREIGIRLALGARPSGILRLVVGQGLALAAVALVAGLAGALALTHFLSTLLFGVGPRDPATLTVAAGVLTVVALGATAWPAWRAARVDPVQALKTGE
jgi:putative ABC transport system permease protein